MAAVIGALFLCLTACGGGGRQTATTDLMALKGKSTVRLATDAARAFLAAYDTRAGRVRRTDQGGDTVSESQAYGMLAAAAVGDRSRFAGIWSWTQAHLQRPDGLFAFHWADGRVIDHQPAADADLDTARALLVAACRFGQPALRTAAIRIGHAVLSKETGRAGSLYVLLAGPWANKQTYLVFNPSYVDPLTLTALAQATGDRRFSALAAGGRTLVDELTRPLPPDWATVSTATGQPTPVSGAGSTAGPGAFSYDAPRTLVRFALDSVAAGRATVARAWSVFERTAPVDIVSEHQLSGAAVRDTHSPVTLAAVAGAAKAAGDTVATGRLLNQAQRFNNQHPTYYGTAWVALGRLMLTTNRLRPCAG